MSAFIEDRRAAGCVVELTCRTLGVSASAHYGRRVGPPSKRSTDDAVVLGQIRDVHDRNFNAYGYRRTWKQLGREGVEAAAIA